MKLRNFTLALIAVALLPAFAHAEDNADPVRASFERDFASQYSLTTNEPDQVQASFERAFNREPAKFNEPDQVLASFERELNHEPAQFEIALVNKEADPLDAIFAGLRPMSTVIHAKFAHIGNRGSSL